MIRVRLPTAAAATTTTIQHNSLLVWISVKGIANFHHFHI
jgi:hypothetical protein